MIKVFTVNGNITIRMTPEDNSHLNRILKATLSDTAEKYIKGNKEHGGHLFEKPCMRLILQENIDQNTYIRTAIEQHEKAISMLKEIIKGVPQTNDIVKVINLLECGNVEGVKYDD